MDLDNFLNRRLVNHAETFVLTSIVDHRPSKDAELLIGRSQDRDFAREVPLPTDGVFDGEGLGEEFHRCLGGEVALVVGGGTVHLVEQLQHFGLVVGHEGFVLRRQAGAEQCGHQPYYDGFLFHLFFNGFSCFLFCLVDKKDGVSFFFFVFLQP